MDIIPIPNERPAVSRPHINTNFSVIKEAIETLQEDSGPSTGGLTDVELRATPVPVLGPLTDAELRASAVSVSIGAMALPTGASTAALQVTGNTSLASIDTKTPALASGRVPVDGSGVTQPVSGPLTDTQLRATAIPVSIGAMTLPTGASTSALQTTGNSSLGSIDGKLPALASGRVPVDGSGVIQPVSGTVAVTGTFFQPTQPVSLAASVAVTGPLTDTQLRASAVPVSIGAMTLPTGASTEAKQDTGNGLLASIDTSADNLDVALSTRLKPDDTLAGVTAVGSITNALPTGTNKIGNTQLTGGATSQALGLGATVTAYGNLRVTAESGELFSDVFDGVTIDSNRWNTAVVSGMTLSQASGNLNTGTTTTNSNSAYIDSVPTFLPIGVNFLVFGCAVKLEAQSANLFALNQHRFIGFGDRPASFDTTTPLKNAIGFEIGTDGQLYCVVYASGVNKFRSSVSLTGVNLNTLITPSTGFVRLGMASRADAIIFYINTTEYPAQSFSVSTVTFSLPDVQALPIRVAAVNAPSGTVGATTFVASNLGVGDTGSNGQTIKDGTYAFRKAKVDVNGGFSVSGSSTTLPTESTPYLPVYQAPQKTWRSGFDATVGSGVDTVYMTVIANGSGIATSQSAGSLVITSGTTAYSETIIRSVPSWYGTLKSRYSLTLSQRIINCEVYIELVDVIGDGLTIVHTNSTTVVVTIPSNPFTAANVGQGIYIGAISVAASLNQRATIASVSGNDVTFTGAGFAATGTGTASLYGWNFHHVYYDGTTATTTKYGTQRNGWTSADAVATINTTAAGHVAVMTSDSAKAAYFDQLSASSTTVELAQRASSVRNVPEDQTVLRFQVRVRNLAVAPLSTTTVTVGFLELDQFIPHQVSIVSVEAQSANQALPFQLVGAAGVLATVSTVTTVSTLSNTTQLTPGVAAANLGKAEDAVAASADTGVFVLGVRRDALVISASTTGDYNELATDSYGSLQVRSYEKQARTYSAAALVTVAASATDIFTITGSATTTVFITRLIITAVATAATVVDTFLVKRSTADTAGTSTAAVAIPHDSSDAAGTATCLNYSANPTTGTLVGSVRRNHIAAGTPTGVDAPFVFDFGDKGRPVVLRGIAQVLAINLNGVTVTGGLFNVSIEWFEI